MSLDVMVHFLISNPVSTVMHVVAHACMMMSNICFMLMLLHDLMVNPALMVMHIVICLCMIMSNICFRFR